MTADTITIEKIRTLELYARRASEALDDIADDAEDGDIKPEEAARLVKHVIDNMLANITAITQ